MCMCLLHIPGDQTNRPINGANFLMGNTGDNLYQTFSTIYLYFNTFTRPTLGLSFLFLSNIYINKFQQTEC